MLDKRLPYRNLIMRLPVEGVNAAPPPRLPEGYGFRLFADGDEKHWARVETSVLEFPTEKDACDYFTCDYLPDRAELARRLVFVTDPAGLPVATAMAWFADGPFGYQASVHWVGVGPAYQGLGLGKAVVAKTLELFRRLDPGQDVWLHTQTWSHPAVRMYRRLGFRMQQTARLALRTRQNGTDGFKILGNDFTGALTAFRDVYEPELIAELAATAD